MIDVDVHAHLAPIEASRLAGLAGVEWSPADERLTLDGHAIGMKDLFHPERLLAWMDERGIRKSLVSIPPPLYRQGLPASDALAWTNYVNEVLLETVQRHAGRLEALFYVPLEHPELIDGLMRSYRAGSYAGVALAAGGHPGIVYSREEYHRLWRVLNECKSFVFIHPGACDDPRLAPYYLENLVGNPYETGVAASHMVMAGIPGKYADVRFCLAHAGGVFPCLCGRLQRGFLTRRPGVNVDGVEPPLQAARRFYADGIAHDDAALALARAIFGADHVLYGSDWPFPMGLKELVQAPAKP